MKVLVINGSPNEFGCTFTALSEIAETLTKAGVDSEIIWLGQEAIKSCTACGACHKQGKCVFDDIVNEVAAKCEAADGFVFGSPVHYAGATGAITAFLGRLFFSNAQKLKLKPAAAIASCRRSGITSTLEQLNKYITINQMPLVSSQYWSGVHGFKPEDVRQDLEGMQIMRTIGRNMAWLLKSIEAGRAAGIALPEKEPRVATNFIKPL